MAHIMWRKVGHPFKNEVPWLEPVPGSGPLRARDVRMLEELMVEWDGSFDVTFDATKLDGMNPNAGPVLLRLAELVAEKRRRFTLLFCVEGEVADVLVMTDVLSDWRVDPAESTC